MFERPRSTDERFSLFEHCARALDVSLVVGNHELPLIGTFGLERRLQPDREWRGRARASGSAGSSPICCPAWRMISQGGAATPSAPERYHVKALELRESLDRSWDGAWYRRACARRWDAAGLLEQRGMPHRFHRPVMGRAPGAGDPLRRRIAMDAVDRLLVDRRNGLIAPLTPPSSA